MRGSQVPPNTDAEKAAELEKIIGFVDGEDKDRTPEEIRSAILRVHNAVLKAAITTAQATQAIKALELYARVSGMMVVEQAVERKTKSAGFDPGA